MSNVIEFVSDLARQLEAAEETHRPIPSPSPPTEFRELTIGMATYDDFDGVFFTIQSIRLHHPEVADRVAFLVVDNHPEGRDAAALKALEETIPNYRYVPFRSYRSTAVRDLVFREANSEIVLCLDDHVLLAPGALLDHFEANPNAADIIQGPMLVDDGTVALSCQEPRWSKGMFGVWDATKMERRLDGPPFEIAMQGLGTFACRRKAWPGINPRFRGHGGEEGYLHEKFRRQGGRVLCHPNLRWLHRFRRPGELSFEIRLENRLRNYLLGWKELGWDNREMLDHFRAELCADQRSDEFADELISRVQREASNPFTYFDAIVCLNLDDRPDRWQESQARFAQLQMAWMVERFPAIATPENYHRGCALSFRSIIAGAKSRGLNSILVIEDDAIWSDNTHPILTGALTELADQPWDLLYLGGCPYRHSFGWNEPRPIPGMNTLREPVHLTCTHAIAFHHTAYDRILTDIPDSGAAFDQWIERHIAVDQYLPSAIADGKYDAFIVHPRIASQPHLAAHPNGDGAMGPWNIQ